jgi:phospholipid-binding lipoprotein MlaA
VNGLLQGQIDVGAREFARLVINSTFGVVGFFDVASNWGIKQQHEDVGQTLAVWGLEESPYVYIPLLGPSTVRDIPVRLVAMSVPRLLIGEDFPGYGTALRVVGQRAGMIGSIEQRNANAIDPYTFTRDAYTQLRAFEIYNGDPPVEDFFDEFEDE